MKTLTAKSVKRALDTTGKWRTEIRCGHLYGYWQSWPGTHLPTDAIWSIPVSDDGVLQSNQVEITQRHRQAGNFHLNWYDHVGCLADVARITAVVETLRKYAELPIDQEAECEKLQKQLDRVLQKVSHGCADSFCSECGF